MWPGRSLAAYAEAHGLKPRARILAAVHNIGGDPRPVLNAPVSAAKKALARAD